MSDINARWARALLASLTAAGVSHAVVSPGSRNTPIVLAMAELEQAGTLTIDVVLDERVAAFRALGIARVTGRPVLLSCTSGSAGAHWLPAFVEASASGIALIGITADRPAELHGSGAPQTVPQGSLFGEHQRLFVDLSEPHQATDARWLGTVAARVVDAATGPNPGPVHINAPFRKPLWNAPPQPQGEHPRRPMVVRGRARLPPAVLDQLATALQNRTNGAIVAGPRDMAHTGPSDRFAAAAHALAQALGWPLVAEPASRGRHPGSNTIRHADVLLRVPRVAADLRAEHVLRFGRQPTNKAVYRWAAKADSTDLVDPLGRWLDPQHRADTVLAADDTWLCEQLCDRLAHHQPDPRWLGRWKAVEPTLDGHLGTGWWEGAVVHTLLDLVPSGAMVHLASSMAVRHADTWAGLLAPNIGFTSSRGANGIDGTIATAAGQASQWQGGPSVLITGDLALLHDVGGLTALAHHPDPLVIVVIDNRGGGIFERLPVREQPAFERFFRTPQNTDIGNLCRGLGLPVSSPQSLDELRHGFVQQLQKRQASVIVAAIDPREDERIRNQAIALAGTGQSTEPH